MSNLRPATRSNGRLSSLVVGLLLVAMTVLAYSPALGGGFIWDDDDYVYENPLLPATDGLKRIWTTGESPQYYPLVFTTFWLEYRLWGLQAGGYHIVNVLLHAINAVLVWWLLRRMGFGGAYIVAVIFALHPVHVESVAWITERKNVLSGLCYLLSVGSYLRFEATERRRWYASALVLFVLGLLSKTIVCTLPIALLLLRWWRQGPIGLKNVLRLVPFVLVGGIMGTATAVYEHYNVLHGAHGAHWALSMPERVIVAGRAVWFYTSKLLWPSPLVFNYPRWQINPADALQWLWPLAAVLAAAGLWMLRERWGRGLTVAAWFTAITLSPALGFVNVAPMRFSFVADHFQYLASLGVIAAAVGVAGFLIRLVKGSETPTRRGTARLCSGVLTTVVVAALGTLTYQQAFLYRDVEDLWRHTIRHNPGSWLARGNLGVLLRERGELDEAADQFEYMLAHCVPWPEPQAQAHTNLGHIHRLRGDYRRAAHHYDQALTAMPNKHEARFSLAVTHYTLGDYEDAETQYRRYLNDNPEDARAHFNLALALDAQEQAIEAEKHYLQALRHDPHLGHAHRKLARLYQKQGRAEKTVAHYRAALQISPGSADLRILFADYLRSTGHREEALEVLQTGLRLDPQSDQLKAAFADLRETQPESEPG